MQPPQELTEIAQWIVWKYAVRDGKATKVPCHVSGRPASVTDRGAWLTYLDARQAVEDALADASDDHPPHLAGIGFCFSPDDPFVGVDLDECWPHFPRAAREIVAALPTYAEISPSGTGLKLFAQGDVSRYSRSRTAEVPGFGQIEVYSEGRFFTVTGEQFGLYDSVNEVQEGLDWLMDTYLPNPVPTERRERHGTGAMTDDDAELLDLMYSFANGQAARSLFAGHDERGDSEATHALLFHLAFVCGPDPEKIDRLFRQSALMRDKWDERRPGGTWGSREIDKVLAQMTEFYSPPGTPDAELSAWADDLAGEATGEGGVEVTPLLDGVTAGSAPSTSRPEQPSPSAVASFPIPERGLIRDVIDLFQGRTEVPDETLALCMLATMSAVTGWNRYVKWGESPEPAIIYAMIIGKSALSKKSTGMRSVSDLWHRAEVDVSLTAQHASGRALVEAAMGGVDIFKVKPQKVPVDATPEEASMIEMENMELESRQREILDYPPPVVLEWDEFGTMLNVQGRWQEDTRVQLLQLYNGRHSGIQTTGRDGLKVPGGRASMALIGTMTMEDLCRSLNMGQVGDGLIGRILFSPPGPPKPALPTPPPETPEYEARRAEVVEKIKAYAERVTKRAYHAYDGWTEEANKAYTDWYMRVREKIEDDDLVGAMFGRGAVTCVKLAALLAAAESTGWDEDAAGITIVEAHHMEQAIGIIEASWKMAHEAINYTSAAQADRWCDAAVELVASAPEGYIPQWDLVRRALVPKEPGDRAVTRKDRAQWIADDPRLILDKTNNRGYVVRVA